MLLPWLMIGIAYSTQYARFSRGAMVDALNEDFVRTARAKGVRERTVTRKHALRAAVVPVVTIFGLDFAGLLIGTIFTEKIFGIQGIGLTALEAVQRQDLPMISAVTLMSAAFIVLANIVVDILYSVIDPRVRLS
jgi:peptide/nickel transport system permease protein